MLAARDSSVYEAHKKNILTTSLPHLPITVSVESTYSLTLFVIMTLGLLAKSGPELICSGIVLIPE